MCERLVYCEFSIALIHSVGKSSGLLISRLQLSLSLGGAFNVYDLGAFRNDIFDDINQLDEFFNTTKFENRVFGILA